MLSWVAVILFAVLVGLWCVDSLMRGRKSKNGCGLPPGPMGLPFIGHFHMLGDLPHRSLQKLAKKYGPIMQIRLGMVPTIVVSSPEAAELVLKTHDLVFASRPKLRANRDLFYGEKDMVYAEYGPHWRHMRKVCTLELLSSTKIESMKSMRTEDVENFVKGLRCAAEAREIVDVSQKVGSLIENMTYSIVFGRKFDMLDFKSSAHEVMRLWGAFNLADYVPFVAPFDLQMLISLGIRSSMKAVVKVIDKSLDSIIDEHVRDVKTKQGHHQQIDFVDVMLSLTESNSEHQLDRASMKAIMFDVIGGAIDTSRVSIEWTFSELLRHPRVLKKLQSEVENVVSMERMVKESDLAKLEYLDAVVKESMRLHPVGPLLVPRESREDIILNGYYIPKKSRVLVNTWAIGHDPEVWSANVEEFYPERFIGIDIGFINGKDFRFLPFGYGRRGCPGMQLGVVVVKIILAQLVHCFNWELPDGLSAEDIDMVEKFGLAAPMANHLLVKPTFRLNI